MNEKQIKHGDHIFVAEVQRTSQPRAIQMCARHLSANGDRMAVQRCKAAKALSNHAQFRGARGT